MKNFDKIRVGGVYKDGRGVPHTITYKTDRNGSYPYRTDDKNNCGFTEDGFYYEDYPNDPDNLVEEIKDENLRLLKQMIDMLKPDSSFYEKKQAILAILDNYVQLR